MAGHYTYGIATGSVGLSASATKSMWLLDPVTNPVTICEMGVSFDASAASTAVRVDLYVVATLGTPAGGTVVPVKWMDQNAPAATTTVLTALSSEPTTVSVLANWFIQPFGGNQILQYPLMREPGTAAAATTSRLGLRCVTPSGVTPNCVSYVVIDEG